MDTLTLTDLTTLSAAVHGGMPVNPRTFDEAMRHARAMVAFQGRGDAAEHSLETMTDESGSVHPCEPGWFVLLRGADDYGDTCPTLVEAIEAALAAEGGRDGQ